MQILCGKKDTNSCFCYRNKTKLSPYLVSASNFSDQAFVLYKVKTSYKTKQGFKVPSDVYVIKWNLHTFGLLPPGEVPILIPIINCDRINDNEQFDQTIFIGIPDEYLKLIDS